jgi:hypothetical protein
MCVCERRTRSGLAAGVLSLPVVSHLRPSTPLVTPAALRRHPHRPPVQAVEVAAAIRGMPLKRAQAYLDNVLEHKEAIPFQTFKGGRGRHAQAKNLRVPGSLVGWPKAAVKAVQNLLANATANAESKALDLGAWQSILAPRCRWMGDEGGRLRRRAGLAWRLPTGRRR